MAGGFVGGAGNAWAQGGSFSDCFRGGFTGMVMGGICGAATAGVMGGIGNIKTMSSLGYMEELYKYRPDLLHSIFGASDNSIIAGLSNGALASGIGGTLGGGILASSQGDNFLADNNFNSMGDWETQTPYQRIASTGQGGWDLNKDGKLQKSEADRWWLKGGGDIWVDNSKIDWSGLKIPTSTKVGHIFSINTTQAFRKLPYETAATYGGTSFIREGLSTVKVMDQLYHYQYRPNNSAENIVRNFMNWVGKPRGEGKDYMIHYINPYIYIK